jgi:hypothetical protein
MRPRSLIRGNSATLRASGKTSWQATPDFPASLSILTCRQIPLPQAGLRTLACSALEQLRSPVACGGLTIAMHDSDPDVAEAAWRALRAITGLDLPRDADSVRELLRSS